jgi:hypothetical protein
MNPDTGRFETMREPEDFARIHNVLTEKAAQLQEAVDEVAGDVPEDHPLVMTLRERMKVLNDQGKPPIFTPGEYLVIRGVAFRVGKLTHKGMLLRPVKDQALIDMVKTAEASG